MFLIDFNLKAVHSYSVLIAGVIFFRDKAAFLFQRTAELGRGQYGLNLYIGYLTTTIIIDTNKSDTGQKCGLK